MPINWEQSVTGCFHKASEVLHEERNLNKAKQLYQEAAEYEYPDAIEALERLSK